MTNLQDHIAFWNSKRLKSIPRSVEDHCVTTVAQRKKRRTAIEVADKRFTAYPLAPLSSPDKGLDAWGRCVYELQRLNTVNQESQNELNICYFENNAWKWFSHLSHPSIRDLSLDFPISLISIDCEGSYMHPGRIRELGVSVVRITRSTLRDETFNPVTYCTNSKRDRASFPTGMMSRCLRVIEERPSQAKPLWWATKKGLIPKPFIFGNRTNELVSRYDLQPILHSIILAEREWGGRVMIVAHNGRCDAKFLMENGIYVEGALWCDLWTRKDLLRDGMIDTGEVFSAGIGKGRTPGLKILAKEFLGIEEWRLHNGGNDAAVTLLLVLGLLYYKALFEREAVQRH